MKEIRQLSADGFEELIKDKKVKLIDVREKNEFNAGYIKGAILVPSTNFNEEFEKLKIKKKDKIAIYCRSGSRSDFISRKLFQEGYENIYNLEVGIIEWLEYGKKLVK